jgi:two-component system sensor histidine kinase/response regulator
MAAGMNDFVSKPFAAESLLQTVARWTKAGAAASAHGREASPARNATLPATLPGISIEEGLRYLRGNEMLYRNLLLRFRLDHGRADQQIALFLADGKRVEAEREAHSIKGLAGQMAAHALSACAARLERVIQTNGLAVNPALTEFARELAVVMQGLSELGTDALRAPESAAGKGEALPLAERVSQLLDANDPDARTSAEQLRDSLSGQMRLPADDLVRCLRNYDFDGAKTALGEVLTSLGRRPPEESHDQQA